MVPNAVYGAETSVSISGGGTVSQGQTVTVTVKYTGTSLGYVNGSLTYNNANLQYLSGGSSQGDSGLVQLKTWSDDASGKIIFNLKFKAVKSGTADMSVSTSETQDLDGQSMGAPSASKSISVTGSQQKQTTTAQETTKEAAATIEQTTETQPATTEATSSEEGVPSLISEEAPAPEENKGMSTGAIIGIGAAIVVLIFIIAVILHKKRKR